MTDMPLSKMEISIKYVIIGNTRWYTLPIITLFCFIGTFNVICDVDISSLPVFQSMQTIFSITGSIAIPGACIGIFMGGCLLKRLELRPKGAVQFVLISNTICLSCYALLFFLGCDNIKMAGTTIPYTNNRYNHLYTS